MVVPPAGDGGRIVGGTGAEAHLLQSRAVTAPHGGVHSRRNRRRRGRLQPRDYVIARMEQTDQLWYMDGMGYVRSAFDCQRCMALPSSHVSGGGGSGGGGGGDVVAEEAPVEIGPRAGWEGGGTTRISVDSYMAKMVG